MIKSYTMSCATCINQGIFTENEGTCYQCYFHNWRPNKMYLEKLKSREKEGVRVEPHKI